MGKYLIVSLGLLVSFLFAEQAAREKPDATDNVEIHPLSGLHYMELSVEKDVFEQKGITDKKASDDFYFRVEGEEDYTKVSYFGTNLSEYLTNVEPAYDLMSSYRNLKMAHSGLFWGGIALSALGASFYFSNKEISPVLFVGVGSFSLSWIPNMFSQSKIPEAVGTYNESIQKYQASNTTKNHTP
jgi:hypothetical protein